MRDLLYLGVAANSDCKWLTQVAKGMRNLALNLDAEGDNSGADFAWYFCETGGVQGDPIGCRTGNGGKLNNS